DFSYCRLSAVSCQLSAIHSVLRTTHCSLPTIHSLRNLPCGEAKRAPAARANIAAPLPALLENISSRAHTFLFRDTRGPNCNAGNGAVRSGALQSRVRATESLHQSVPVRSDTRQCHYRDC